MTGRAGTRAISSEGCSREAEGQSISFRHPIRSTRSHAARRAASGNSVSVPGVQPQRHIGGTRARRARQNEDDANDGQHDRDRATDHAGEVKTAYNDPDDRANASVRTTHVLLHGNSSSLEAGHLPVAQRGKLGIQDSRRTRRRGSGESLMALWENPEAPQACPLANRSGAPQSVVPHHRPTMSPVMPTEAEHSPGWPPSGAPDCIVSHGDTIPVELDAIAEVLRSS